MKNLFSIFISVITFFAVSSCNKDEGPFLKPTASQSDTVKVSYTKEIQPIFNSYCVTCHSEQHAKLNLKSCCSYEQLLEIGFSASYVDTAMVDNSNLYKHITGSLSLMPPSGKLSQDLIDKIKNWIKQGAKNN